MHASGEDFGTGRASTDLDHDNGPVDVGALKQMFPSFTTGRKLPRKIREERRAAKEAEKEAKKSYTSVKSQLRDRDHELSEKTADARRRREAAKDVVRYIGYNRMYQDGICEVEEGLFSSTIAFDDTSYHSVRDD